ncbi:MAG TPA: dihydrofolate reductase family protein [Candidatus Nanoarchaeia archaeon]|nr:dihydrofolate reductase family protein [Candidatus Nanoarchaeia archaeon]
MNRPYVTLNAAVSCDGKLASRTRAKFRFSNDEDAKVIDAMRSDSDAILIGATTLAMDNPRLIVHGTENQRLRTKRGKSPQPAKVTISPDCMVDPQSNFFQVGEGNKYVFTTNRAKPEDIAMLESVATVVQHETERVDILLLLQELYNRGIRKLLVEGGGSTNFEFIKEKVADEIRIAIAPMLVGGAGSPTLVDGMGFDPDNAPNLQLLEVQQLEEIVAIRYKFRDVAGGLDAKNCSK